MKLSRSIYVMLGVTFLLLQWNFEHAEAQQQNRIGTSELDIATIEQVTGMKGVEENGEYKLTVPQNDLNVTVDGFDIIPPMGMGSWAAFSPTEDGAILMGDIVVQQDEIAEVQHEVIENGLKMTGLHNHFVREEPDVMYMHIGGQGSEKELAAGVKAVFDKITELRGANPGDATADEVTNELDTNRIVEILGHEGSTSRGVYKVTIGRPDVDLMVDVAKHLEQGKEHGKKEMHHEEKTYHKEEGHHEESEQEHGHKKLSTFMGFNTWAAWQGTPEEAAVAGDFVMLADEVEPVVRALVKNGIEVVALHNHMIYEEPRVFFLHYWATGPAEKLAKGLREALNQTGPASKTSDAFDGKE